MALCSSPPKVVGAAKQIAAVGAEYCKPYKTEVAMKEKLFSWSGDDFAAKDYKTADTLFLVEGKSLDLTVTGEKKLKDVVTGETIAVLQQMMHTVDKTWHIYAGSDSQERRACVMKRSWAWTTTYDVYIHSPPYPEKNHGTKTTERDHALVVKAGMWPFSNPKHLRIFRGEDGECVGKMKKDSKSLQAMVLDRDVYKLKLGPNLDSALMVLVAVAIDEMQDSDWGAAEA